MMAKNFEIFKNLQMKLENGFPGKTAFFEPEDSRSNIVQVVSIDQGPGKKHSFILWDDTIGNRMDRISFIKDILPKNVFEHQGSLDGAVQQRACIERSLVVDFRKESQFISSPYLAFGEQKCDLEAIWLLTIFLESIQDVLKPVLA
ncbi:MAG: hypothetical protein JWM20_226 [Patescibacteria group bacterium]|nr:hypothetical protein [Patescibacteria group bacterium]